MYYVEANLFKQSQCMLKFLCRLAAEAHDDIGRERHSRPPGAQLVDEHSIFSQSIAAPHSLKHAVIAMLYGDIDMRADLGQCCHVLNQLIGEMTRIRGHKPDPLETDDIAEALHKIAQIRILIGKIQAIS